VEGRPAPQGSKHRGAAGQLREASHYLAAWRNAVKIATYRAYDLAGVTPDQLPLLRDAVVVEHLAFRLGGDTRADGPPDLDKLTRATFDALTDARLWEDDARVVEVRRLSKRRPASGEVPGADIIICTLEDHQESDHIMSNAKRYVLSLREWGASEDIDIVEITGTADIIEAILPTLTTKMSADSASVVLPAPSGEIEGWKEIAPGVNMAPVSAGPVLDPPNPHTSVQTVEPLPPGGATPAPAPVEDKPKRKRATKAEMAARRAAAASGNPAGPPMPVLPGAETHVTPVRQVPAQEPYNPFAAPPAGVPVGAPA
jgi:hypothetical protein